MRELVVRCATGVAEVMELTPEEITQREFERADPPPALEQVQQAKISDVTDAYQKELCSGFTSTATGTALEYDYSQTSQDLWKELFNSMTAGFIPDVIFPMDITLKDSTVVPHTKAQLQQIGGEVTVRKLSLYGKLQGMVAKAGSIMSASTIDKVNEISW